MNYFRVGSKDDTLQHHVWADNPAHAVRKVEALFGGLPPQRTFSLPCKPEDVPEGDEVIDEPEMEREERTDAHEKEDET